MRWLLILLPLLLAGCIEEKSKQPECFEVIAASKTADTLMMNKCTGETWMLVYVPLAKAENGKPEVFTYRWFPLVKGYGEPEMSRGGF